MMKSILSFTIFCILILCVSCKENKLEVSRATTKVAVHDTVKADFQTKEFKFEEESKSAKQVKDSIKMLNQTAAVKVLEDELESQSESQVKKRTIKLHKKTPKKKTSKKTVEKGTEKGKLTFIQNEFDFGFIEVGEVVDHKFRFVNTGSAPVSISNAIASCGCTTPVFPFLDIEPGNSGEIAVRFNSKDRLGSQIATVTVYSNADNKEQELTIKGVIRSDLIDSTEFIDTIK